MSGTVTIINTALTGAPGSNAGNLDDGTPGGPGGDESAPASFSNQDFSSVPDSLGLAPSITGGLGGGGTRGTTGGAGAANTTTGAGGATNTVTQAGTAGGPGGGGGVGGMATLAMADDSVGTTATPYAGGFELDAQAIGGEGGDGNLAGSGGSGGENENIDVPGFTVKTAQGSTGGAGGLGGSGGAGGAAVNDVSGLTSTVGFGTSLEVDAFGGAGGAIGLTQSGGAGGFGGETSAGGDGGAGGAGGAASATFADVTAADQYSVDVKIFADGGAGAAGGAGGDGGAAVTVTDTSATDTSVGVFGHNGAGGAGGAGGAAAATLTGSSLTAADVEVSLTAIEGDGAAGGTGATAVSGPFDGIDFAASAPGATGAAGASGSGLLTFTDNILTVGTTLSGDSSHSAGDQLSITLTIEGVVTPGGEPQSIPLNGAAGGNLVFSGNQFLGTGASSLDLSLGGTGSAIVDTADDTISFDGSPANTMSGFSTFDLDNNDTFVTGTGDYVVTYASDPDTLVFLPNSGNVTLDGVTSGNLALQFNGFGAALTVADVQADTTTSDGGSVIAIPGAGTIDLAGYTGAIPTGDIALATACYLAGTRIATARGDVAVEALAVGDVVAARFAGAAPVVWLGHRRIDCRRHPAPHNVWPVRVAAGAFGANRPRRDLFLSPDHAVFCAGVLIPVRYLVNGTTVAQVPRATVWYFHVELARHDVLSAEGLPCESFLDSGNRGDFDNGGPVLWLHPAFARRAWDAGACAELVVAGTGLKAARRWLHRHACSPPRPGRAIVGD